MICTQSCSTKCFGNSVFCNILSPFVSLHAFGNSRNLPVWPKLHVLLGLSWWNPLLCMYEQHSISDRQQVSIFFVQKNVILWLEDCSIFCTCCYPQSQQLLCRRGIIFKLGLPEQNIHLLYSIDQNTIANCVAQQTRTERSFIYLVPVGIVFFTCSYRSSNQYYTPPMGPFSSYSSWNPIVIYCMALTRLLYPVMQNTTPQQSAALYIWLVLVSPVRQN